MKMPKKEVEILKELKMLEILNQIEVCIKRNSLDIAKDLIQLEVENLKGITQKNCSKTRYYFYDWACKYCLNMNCESNKSF